MESKMEILSNQKNQIFIVKIHLIILTQSHKTGYEFGEFNDILYHCGQFFGAI